MPVVAHPVRVGLRGQISRVLQSSDLLVDKFLIYPFWIGMILSVQLALFLLVIDAARLLLFPVYRRHKAQWLRIQARVVMLIVGVGSAYVIARIYNDTFTVRTRQTEIQIKNLPPLLIKRNKIPLLFQIKIVKQKSNP